MLKATYLSNRVVSSRILINNLNRLTKVCVETTKTEIARSGVVMYDCSLFDIGQQPNAL